MKYDAFIAGGGPAGCRAAELIARSGYKVMVAEEHRDIGKPVQCAGLVSPRTMITAGVSRDIVLNEIYGAFVNSPGGERLAFKGKKAYALVTDRAALRILNIACLFGRLGRPVFLCRSLYQVVYKNNTKNFR